MRKLTKAAGLLFLAVSSVYFDGATGVNPASASPASPASPVGATASGRRGASVQPLPDAEPAPAPADATAPTTKPASTQPSTQPATQPTRAAQAAQAAPVVPVAPVVQVSRGGAGQPLAPGQVAVKDVGYRRDPRQRRQPR